MAQKSKVRRVHYVLSTHWDREWYRTFQGFRRQLVHLMDGTLEGLSNNFLKGPFTTDGQSILLEDYLEIRPERGKLVEGFVKAGKLQVGPWYILPDEWLVSGESIIRNLRLGRQIARKFGAPPSQAGFVCDLFGHISQLPQIFRGFGIDNAFLWRGVEPRKNAHFHWEGADGSRVLCFRFTSNGYCDFGFDVRKLSESELPFDRERVWADLQKYLQKEVDRTAIPPLLLFDGGDHMHVDKDVYQVLTEAKTSPEFPYEIVFTTLDDYMEEVSEHAGSIRDVVRGELREAGHAPADKDMQWLIPGVLSSRVWIKQENAECQTLLCSWAEPFASMASALLNEDYPTGYLDVAWRWLLQNHPHDSICGCSIDEVHEDMKYRFAQCRQIASEQTDESLHLMAAAVEGDIAKNELRVLVANPATHALDEPITLTLQLPAEWGVFYEFFGYEPKPAFRIFDDQNREVPFQVVAQDMNRGKHRYVPTKIPVPFRTNDVTVVIRLPLPSLGYTTLTVREGEKAPGSSNVRPTRHAQTPGLATSERSMENDHLSVTIEANGTLTVQDKRTKEIYHRLLTLEDNADIGDGWFNAPPVNDQTFVSSSQVADVARVADGPSLCTYRVRIEMRVPVEFNRERMKRSDTFEKLVIDSLITLRAGCDRIEVSTTIDNPCRDHRVRALFPSGTKAAKFFADSAFDVVERTVALPADTHLGRELVVDASPQQSWTAIVSGKRGLAIISKGLPEAAVYDLPERPVALTLFRSTRKTVFTDGEPGGQLPGKMTFDFWIVPLAGKVDRHHLCDYGQQISAGIKTAQLRQPDLAIYRRSGKLLRKASFLEIKGGAIATSVRRVGSSLEVRLFNPESTKISSTLVFPQGSGNLAKSYRSVTTVDLESKPLAKPVKVGSKLALSLKPKEIITLQLE